jgi:hypothetical protein
MSVCLYLNLGHIVGMPVAVDWPAHVMGMVVVPPDADAGLTNGSTLNSFYH